MKESTKELIDIIIGILCIILMIVCLSIFIAAFYIGDTNTIIFFGFMTIINMLLLDRVIRKIDGEK